MVALQMTAVFAVIYIVMVCLPRISVVLSVLALLTLWVLFTLVATGCGGSGSSSYTPVVNRFLAFENAQPATAVIGQEGFTQAAYNKGGTAMANTLGNPFGSPFAYYRKLYLPDYGNHRVLVYDALPSEAADSNPSATVAIGQFGFNSTEPLVSANSMSGPLAIIFSDQEAYVAEWSANRVLIFKYIPDAPNARANLVLGQQDFINSPAGCSASSLRNPSDVFVAGNKIIISDTGNNRVLVYNDKPEEDGAPADVAIGQSSADSCDNTAADSGGLDRPMGIWAHDGVLYIADSGNNRVAIYNSIPSESGTLPDYYIGQSGTGNTAANDDDQDGIVNAAPSARTLNEPTYLSSNGMQLFIADTGNNRVLIYNSLSFQGFDTADAVLGQADFATDAPNDADGDGVADAAPSATTLSAPSGVLPYGDKLVVVDTGNNRALVYIEP